MYKIVNGKTIPLSSSEIIEMEEKESKHLILIEEREKNMYKYNRASEYPSIEDQLDTIYHKGIDAWKMEIAAIKVKYPKPGGV